MAFHRLFSTASLALALISLVSVDAAPTFFAKRQNVPDLVGPVTIPPSQDPFYQPPAGWKSKKNGEILRWRQVRNKDKGLESIWQLAFRSSSQNGTAEHGVTTVFIPKDAFRDRLISTARFDNSNNPDCSPSWGYANGSAIDIIFFQRAKYIVSSVDALGSNGALGAGRLGGHLQLDAARAAISFSPASFSKASPVKVGIHGYSAGAISASWATALAAAYAPELNVVGGAFGGSPVNMYAISRIIDGGPFAGLGWLGLFGTARAYDAVREVLDQYLTPRAKERNAAATKSCITGAFVGNLFAKIESAASNTWTVPNRFLDQPVLKSTLDSLRLGYQEDSRTIKIPTFMYHGIVDPIIPISTVDPVVDDLCKGGSNVFYLRTALAEHFADFLNINVVPFFEHRFAGKAWPSGCRRVNTVTAADKVDFTTAVSNQINPFVQGQIDQKLREQKAQDDRFRSLSPSQQADELKNWLKPFNQ